MTGITPQDMSQIAAELRAALLEHDRLSVAIGGKPAKVDRFGDVIEPRVLGAEAIHREARLDAHARSTVMHPERKVREHDVAADRESFDEWATLNALEYEIKAVKERLHTLRQQLWNGTEQLKGERNMEHVASIRRRAS